MAFYILDILACLQMPINISMGVNREVSTSNYLLLGMLSVWVAVQLLRSNGKYHIMTYLLTQNLNGFTQ